MENLVEGLQREMNRCRELVAEYDKIPTGMFGSAMIKGEILTAEKAIAEGDTVRMLKSYNALSKCE